MIFDFYFVDTRIQQNHEERQAMRKIIGKGTVSVNQTTSVDEVEKLTEELSRIDFDLPPIRDSHLQVF